MSALTPPPRGQAGAILMLLPAIIAAGWLAWFEIRQDPPRATPAPASSLADAIRHDAVEEAFPFIRSGVDVNAPIAFRDDELTGGEEIKVTPLLIAVAAGNDDSVAMLMSSGARMDAPGNRFAVCLARRLGYQDLADTMIRNGGAEAAAAACPDAAPSKEAPLRAYVE